MSSTRTRPTQRVLDALADHSDLIEAGKSISDDEIRAALAPEQFERAMTAPAGLRGKALAHYVATGEGMKAQTAKAATSRKATEKTAAKAKAAPRSSGPREGGALHAAMTVLKDAREPLTPQAIYDRAVKLGLAGGLKGKTPVATLAAQLATANKKGVHVERPKPGHYQLRKGDA